MLLTGINLSRFTAFENLALEFSPGLNIFVGENGTGKTHLMKAAYAACEASRQNINFAEKLVKIFLPADNQVGRLVKRNSGSSQAVVGITGKRKGSGKSQDDKGETALEISFSNHTKSFHNAGLSGVERWTEEITESVYIPPKDMLSNAPGFLSLYEKREIHFEEYYVDILKNAALPILKGPLDEKRNRLLSLLEEQLDGTIITKKEEFYLKNKQGSLEFTLLAEGLRKLGLLWVLIRNGVLANGSILFWDEPEANLNPKIIKSLVNILIELQRLDMQIFVATHDYVFLKETDLQRKGGDLIKYHSLYRNDETREIECRSTNEFLQIHPNTISDPERIQIFV
ncbi:MAG: AAA family ATPase [Firmicutes bacterium]|nr:AAA family ATPase [Bacillota bacterium]